MKQTTLFRNILNDYVQPELRHEAEKQIVKLIKACGGLNPVEQVGIDNKNKNRPTVYVKKALKHTVIYTEKGEKILEPVKSLLPDISKYQKKELIHTIESILKSNCKDYDKLMLFLSAVKSAPGWHRISMIPDNFISHIYDMESTGKYGVKLDSQRNCLFFRVDG